jgi:hypothetical protein
MTFYLYFQNILGIFKLNFIFFHGSSKYSRYLNLVYNETHKLNSHYFTLGTRKVVTTYKIMKIIKLILYGKQYC